METKKTFIDWLYWLRVGEVLEAHQRYMKLEHELILEYRKTFPVVYFHLYTKLMAYDSLFWHNFLNEKY